MLVFAAIVPHPPLIIPSVGRENIKKLQKTVKALEDLEGKLYLAKPDVLLVISPHGESHEHTTTVLLDNEYLVNLKEFGDFSTGSTVKPYLKMIERIRRSLRLKEYGVAIQHEAPLNHGFSVPLVYMLKNLPKAKLVPILPSHNELLKKQFEVGKILKDEIMNDSLRIAVIASADLSHKLTSDAPAGFSPKARAFDEDVQKLLETKNSAGILNIHHELMDDVEACGMRSIAMLLGIIDRVSTTTQIFSYEAPFGVGYMVVNFKIS